MLRVPARGKQTIALLIVTWESAIKKTQLRQLERAIAHLSQTMPVITTSEKRQKLKREKVKHPRRIYPCLTDVKKIISETYTSKSVLTAHHKRKKRRRLVKGQEAVLKLFPLNVRTRKRVQAWLQPLQKVFIKHWLAFSEISQRQNILIFYRLD